MVSRLARVRRPERNREVAVVSKFNVGDEVFVWEVRRDDPAARFVLEAVVSKVDEPADYYEVVIKRDGSTWAFPSRHLKRTRTIHTDGKDGLPVVFFNWPSPPCVCGRDDAWTLHHRLTRGLIFVFGALEVHCGACGVVQPVETLGVSYDDWKGETNVQRGFDDCVKGAGQHAFGRDGKCALCGKRQLISDPRPEFRQRHSNTADPPPDASVVPHLRAAMTQSVRRTVAFSLFVGGCDLYRVRGVVVDEDGRPDWKKIVYEGEWKDHDAAERELEGWGL